MNDDAAIDGIPYTRRQIAETISDLAEVAGLLAAVNKLEGQLQCPQRTEVAWRSDENVSAALKLPTPALLAWAAKFLAPWDTWNSVLNLEVPH